MKNLFLRMGAAILLLLVMTAVTFAQSSQRIARIEIKHVGPTSVSDEYIRANIRIKVGDPFISVATDEDVRNLYATGLFYNIRVGAEMTPDGLVITYFLQANPRLTDIRYQGNDKVKTASLKKRVASKIGDPLSELKLFTDAQDLQKFYQKMGYPDTTVRSSVSIEETAGRAVATFEIKETLKRKILRIDFVNASVFSQKQLRKQLKTKKYHWYLAITGKGYLKTEQFEMDQDVLKKFYRDHGYVDFDIKEVKYEYPDDRHIIVQIVVYEGSQYKVGAISFTGAPLFSTNRASEHLILSRGDVFTVSGVSSNATAIGKFYEARGYIDVSSRVGKIPNTESNTIDLDYQVEEGSKSYVEKIEIRGNTKTKDKVIRRELAISPGEVFDMTRVDLSKRRLENLQYFEKVDTRVEPIAELPGHKDLVVGVEEKNTGTFSVGAGFSSVDSLVGFVEVGQGNFDLFNPPRFTGAGQKMRLRIQLGTQRQDYTVDFTEPWFLGRKLSLGVSLFHHEYGFTSLGGLYTESHTGARLSLSKALPRPNWLDRLMGPGDLIGGVSYSIDQIGIIFARTNDVVVTPNPTPPPTNIITHVSGIDPSVPPTLKSQDGYSLLTKVGAFIAYDTRNSTKLPDKGQRTELDFELATTALGGDFNFYKIELKSSWFFKGFGEGHVLELNARSGVAQGFGGQDVPFYERYYLGGLDSMRGYAYRSVSPRDAGFDEPVGGDTYWFASAEYSIPIIDRLRMAWFYDIGGVQLKPFHYNFADYNDNVGIGLRLNLPIGPLRIDYGIPITHDKFNSGGGRFQFGVGYTRQF